MRLILVGGGLADCLIARHLSQNRPEVDWTILEAGNELGGNHTWSFHVTDLTPEQNRWVDPLVEAEWPGYEVRFPGLRRRLALGYRSISAARLRHAMVPCSGWVRAGAPVNSMHPRDVRLETGETLAADAVIGRGYVPSPHITIAYQKFLGLEVRTPGPHGLAAPIVMDATVPQRNGFRFVYVLPLGSDRLLVEDTYIPIAWNSMSRRRAHRKPYMRTCGAIS